MKTKVDAEDVMAKIDCGTGWGRGEREGKNNRNDFKLDQFIVFELGKCARALACLPFSLSLSLSLACLSVVVLIFLSTTQHFLFCCLPFYCIFFPLS